MNNLPQGLTQIMYWLTKGLFFGKPLLIKAIFWDMWELCGNPELHKKYDVRKKRDIRKNRGYREGPKKSRKNRDIQKKRDIWEVRGYPEIHENHD